MTLIAKREPGGALGLEWLKAGDDGAVEVDAYTASVLLRQPEEPFYVVAEKAHVKKEEVKKEEVKEEPKAKAKPVKAESTSENLKDALKEATK